MATVLDGVVVPALKEIGVLAAGETATAQDSADALAALNRLLDIWGAERLQIYTVTRTTWTIASGTGQYNVGSGQTVNIIRPVFLENDAVKYQDTSLSPTTEYGLEKLTEKAWQRITLKDQTADQPGYWYYNPVHPTATIDLWPVPTSSTLEGVIYAPTAVTAFSALTDTVALPPGYHEMLVTNLAVRLAPSYERPINPVLAMQARESKAIVKRANTRLADLDFEAATMIGNDAALAYDIKDG